ncbi:MAG: DNA-3-methyladenine glycosylase [Anaerolineaceae bacterium]
MEILPREFYNRSALTVARDLLGKHLVRLDDGRRISGVIVETEAYQGEDDLGCHARAGRTPRTQIMYGAPGHAYVYFTYGMHWMLNAVTDGLDVPAAVLLRAVIPLEGMDIIAGRRAGVPRAQWTDGPAKLCKSFNIDRTLNGADLCDPAGEIWIEMGGTISDSAMHTGARIGLYSVPEPWKSIPWRFWVTPGEINSPAQNRNEP